MLKDQIDVIGLTVRNGLEYAPGSGLGHDPCTTDAEVTERIKSEGMMIIGMFVFPISLTFRVRLVLGCHGLDQTFDSYFYKICGLVKTFSL